MSNKGMFTALSGAIAQSQRLDTIANNIANANTNAFKKDHQVFKEYLTAQEKPADVIQVPRVPSSIESFYDNQAADRGYVDSAGTFTDHSQGVIKPTGNNFDFALDGEGYFEVLTPQGPQLTRSGAFKIDGTGTLTTKEGFPVLLEGIEGNEEARLIRLSSSNINVSETGQVYENGELIGRLSLQKETNPEVLKKVGSSLYTRNQTIDSERIPAQVLVKQGFIEMSNVNIVNEMTDMIAATRAFESTQKAIQAFDQMNSKMVNDIPKIGR